MDTQEDDALNIQPPQSHTHTKKDKTHKHKHKKKIYDVFGQKVCYADSRGFLFNDTATTGIYTLSLHDALPISWLCVASFPIPWTSL